MRLEKDYLKPRVKELLLELLKIYTPSGEEYKALSFFEKVSKELNLELRVTSSNSYYLGKDSDILLVSHVDTVPGYIEPRDENGIIYGRGAVDDKGPLIAMLMATSILNDKGYSISFAALSDEENKSKGARELVSTGKRYKYIIVGEPSNTSGIVVEYRGVLHVDIKCSDKPQHSSSANSNLIVNIADKILRVSKFPESYDIPSIIPTIFHAGEYINKSPSSGVVHFDIRYSVKSSKEDLLLKIRDVFKDCEIVIVEDIPPVKVSTNSNLVKSIMRGLIKQGIKPSLTRKYGTSDMNILSVITSDIVNYGPGDSKLEHTDYEHISLEEIFISINTYVSAIEELCSKKA
ncbi:N-acetyl-lysine deacetylase [Stygiolobus caldivivus]|uniref:[LysW]-lysine/[LysW]-ornithine hydrolase n=1 Tax=Stygiolobus caldivivus TaxID=2824673 RepID=A0A8D5ZID5_9CREN|nr:N-acetyl-lysine deacetylase [Stygiolobus caldivivus]BCU70514.1 acetyl-lysine deacetylase [Stygiolobus caldivivus]